jgi:hypothetical protein
MGVAIGFSGFTSSQRSEPARQAPAATKNEVVQPKRSAIHGVSEAVTAPPTCPPMFIRPDTVPADLPAMSAVTDQKRFGLKMSFLRRGAR